MPQKQKNKAKKPEKSDLMTTLLLWGLVLCGIGAIAWMIEINPKEKKLVCSNTGVRPSLMSFGTCTTEE
jgi:hypothetical protein